MSHTNDLIEQLAKDPKPAKHVLKPGQQTLLLLGVLLVYAIGAQVHQGLRPDLMHRLTDFWFEAEITALLFLILTSAFASIAAMAPDAYQNPILLRLPYTGFAALIGILVYQLFTAPEMASNNIVYTLMQQASEIKGMGCSLCIALLAIVPSAFMFALIKRGASVRPLLTGSYAVFAAAGIGCLTLRLAEPNDSLMHLIQWHYLPTLLFAILGAYLGKWLLKW